MRATVASKNQLPSSAPRAGAGAPPKPHSGLWLDISPQLGSPQAGAALGPHASQGLWLAPGQTQTLQAQGGRRYRLGLRAKPAPTEALIPTEQPVLVLRHGADLWLSNAQAAGLVLNGFFATPENHLDIELGDQAWHVDGLATGQPIAGSEAHLLYWHGQAAHWPDAFNVSTAEGGFELHKTQWQSVPVPGPTAQASTSATSSAASAEAASATSATSAASSAAVLTPAEAASAASAASQGAATAATASSAAAQTAAGAAATSTAGTSTVAAAASAVGGFGGAAIVVDLNRDGALSYGNVVMDVNGDGLLDATRWAGAQDGVLVWDKYHDGQVHDHSQYAFAQYDTSSAAKGQTATDLSGLAEAFDSNRDGMFDAQDAQFADFSVWQDANQNGVSDADEVKTLAELGLASFSLSSDGVARNPVAGVHEAGHTTATATDGTQVLVADVGFDFTSLTTVAPTSASQGQINQASDTFANLLPLTLQDLLALPTETLFDATLLTETHTVACDNDQSHQVYTVDSAETQLFIDQNIVNAGRVL